MGENRILIGLGALMVAGGLLVSVVLYNQSVQIKNLTALVKNQNNFQNQSQTITEKETTKTEVVETDKNALNKYIITRKGNLKDGFSVSLYDVNGVFIKTIAVLPSDYLYVADSLVVYGSKVYFLSGDQKTTSVLNEIDIKTGVVRALGFTSSKTTVGGVIRKWFVSNDNKKIAWTDEAGKINVANLDGTSKVTSKDSYTGFHRFTNLQFAPDNTALYILSDSRDAGLVKWNFIDNTLTTLITFSVVTISPSGRYVVYFKDNDTTAIVKDIIKNNFISIPLEKDYAFLDNFAFSSNEKSLVFTDADLGGVLPDKTKIVNLENGQISLVKEGMPPRDFVTNSTIVLVQDFKTYLVQSDGTGFKKIVDEDYLGIVDAW